MPTFNERLSQYAILSKMLHYSLPPMQDGERIQQLDDETAQMFRERLFDEHIGKILLFYGKGLIDRELLLTLTADRYPQLDDDLDAAESIWYEDKEQQKYLIEALNVCYDYKVSTEYSPNISFCLAYDSLRSNNGRVKYIGGRRTAEAQQEETEPQETEEESEDGADVSVAKDEPSDMYCGGFVALNDELTEFFTDLGFDTFRLAEERRGEDGTGEGGYDPSHTDEQLLADAYELTYIKDISKVFKALTVYDRVLGRDFIRNAIEYESNDITEEYEFYVKNVRLKFDLAVYERKHSYCAGKCNYIDYVKFSEGGDRLKNTFEPSMTVKDFMLRETDIDKSADVTTDRLFQTALKKYADRTPLKNDAVIIIENTYGKRIFLNKPNSEDFEAVSETEFNRSPFDITKMFHIIQHSPVVRDTTGEYKLNLSQSDRDTLTDEEMVYFRAFAREQINLFLQNRLKNPILQKISGAKPKSSLDAWKDDIKREKEIKEKEQAAEKERMKNDNKKKSTEEIE